MAIPLFKVLMSNEAAGMTEEVLASGFIGQGSKCELFEDQFSVLVDSPRRTLMVNSCTSALDLCFHLLGMGTQEVEFGNVIAPPMSCFATYSGLPHRRVSIRWADVDPKSGLIDPNSIGDLIDKDTYAIIAVDWGGAPCDYDALRQFGVPIIEDAAHGPLISYKGQSIARTGGDYITWSHQAIKTLTTGDGGSLLVPEEHYSRTKLLRWYGLDRESSADFRCRQDIPSENLGFKYQSNDIAAAIGLANIKLTTWAVNQQRLNASFYGEAFKDLVNLGIYCPPGSNDSNWWLYTIVCDTASQRDELSQHLASKGIMSSPVHRRCDHHSCFREFQGKPLPGLDHFASGELAIPVGWWLSPEDQEYIADTVTQWSKWYHNSLRSGS